MSSLRTLLLAAFIATPAWALDPRMAEILTLRLGMTRADVSAHLRSQVHVVVEDGPASINARTVDGQMRVDFAPDGKVRRIAYTIRPHGQAEVPVIRAAMIERYGKPAVSDPLVWCLSPSSAQECPPDQPLLTFVAVNKDTVVLILARRLEP